MPLNSDVRQARRELRELHNALHRQGPAKLHVEALCLQADLPIAWLQGDLRHSLLQLGTLSALPRVQQPGGSKTPHILALAALFLNMAGDTAGANPSRAAFTAFLDRAGQGSALCGAEIAAIPLALRTAALEQIAISAREQSLPAGEPRHAPLAALLLLKRLRSPAWRDLHAKLNPVEQVLLQDPAGIYARMDARSRELYRDAVTRHARALQQAELSVAKAALTLAQRGSGDKADGGPPQDHVGEYLAGSRQPQLRGLLIGEEQTGRPRLLTKRSLPAAVRIGGLCCALASATAYIHMHASRGGESFLVGVACVPYAFLFLRMISALTAEIFFACTKASRLPRLLLPVGIPPAADVLIAVPCLLVTREQAFRAIDRLEEHSLAASDSRVRCALLTDHEDSSEPSDEIPEKRALVLACEMRIRALNVRYEAQDKPGPFYLLHRRQVYAARQRRWMGWERKRGKIEALNALLTGELSSLEVSVGRAGPLRQTRYVLLLDEDTRLRPGVLHALAGTMLHPLNAPLLDPSHGRLSSGFGILQPALLDICDCAANSSGKIPAAGATAQRLRQTARAERDFSQDIYGSTSYRGQGLYDVSVMSALLRHRLPADAFLSHDTVEGLLVRTGFVPVALEQSCLHDFAGRAARSHRWMRGNWQNLLFLVAFFLHIRRDGGARRAQPYPFAWSLLHKCLRGVDEIALVMAIATMSLSRRAPLGRVSLLLLALLEVVPLFSIALRACRNLRVESPAHVFKLFVAALLQLGRRTALRIAFSGLHALLTLDAIVVASAAIVSGNRALDWKTPTQVAREQTGDWLYQKACLVLVVLTALLCFAARARHAHPALALFAGAAWIAGAGLIAPRFDAEAGGVRL